MTNIIKKNINEATPEQKRGFASEFLGIDVTGLEDREVDAKIAAAHEGSVIFVHENPEATPPQTGAEPPKVEGATQAMRLVGGSAKDDPKVRLTLHAEEKDGLVVSRPKEVSVNGVAYQLARGESIEIPYRVFLALNIALKDAVTMDKDGNVNIQQVHNTPFSLEKFPSDAEIADWHRRTDHLFVP